VLARQPSPASDRLGRLLLVTLEAARVDADLPCLPLSAPGSTPGAVSANVERGVARQGYDLQLTRYDERGWRATFYTSGMEHSITSGVYSACFWRCRRGQSRDGR